MMPSKQETQMPDNRILYSDYMFFRSEKYGFSSAVEILSRKYRKSEKDIIGRLIDYEQSVDTENT